LLASGPHHFVFGGVAQLVRARGSYPRRPGFESLHRHSPAKPTMLAQKLMDCIKKYSLIQPGDRVLVAYSGGPDSTCLLILLQQLVPKIAAVYVNHQLRGSESKREEQFVRKFCREKKISLFIETIHWKKKPANLEESARRRRYRHLAKVAEEHGFDKVALAHHRDDAVETFLMHLMRGTGPKGLGGLTRRRGIYIRPMLDCRRSEILSYLRERQVPYFEDTSNMQLHFSRNRIRNELIPYIQKHFNPSFPEAVNRASRWIEEQNELVDELLKKFAGFFEGTVLNRTKWMKLSPRLQKAIVRVWIGSADPTIRLNTKSIEGLVSAIRKKQAIELAGAMLVQSTSRAARIMQKDRPGVIEVDVPAVGNYFFPGSDLSLSFSYASREEFDPEREIAFLDAKKASFPLYIRNWKKGDVFRPLGMKGHKKLSDYLIDSKVPRSERKRIPLVYKDDDLIWVGGHQIHDDYRVTDKTKKLLRIELQSDV
jgi:tRNA(Ile)-lysidine synthase